MNTITTTAVAEPLPGARLRSAVIWLLTGNVSAQVLRLMTSLVLTRLLVPEAFGLMALANTLYLGLQMFSDLGIWQSVVRSERGNDPRFLGTAWAVQLARGGLIATAVLLLAIGADIISSNQWAAADSVYADPRLPGMIACFALVALLQGSESIKIAQAQRQLRCAPVVQLELITQIITIVVAIGGAWLTRSVWALVIGSLVAAAVRTILSHTILRESGARPCWDRESAAELIGFGQWIFLSSMVGFLAANGEKLIIAGLLGAAAFGAFAIATNLLAAVVGLYGALNGRAIFPSLSQAVRVGDQEAIVRQYARVQHTVDWLLGLAAGSLVMLGPLIVGVLFDPRYDAAGWMLGSLAVGLLAMRYQVLEQLMFAQGQPNWVTANNALRALALLISIPVGYDLGGESGAVIGVAGSQFASWPISIYYKSKHGLMTLSSEIAWPLSFAIGLGLGAIGIAVSRLLGGEFAP